jgi:hypothetical protein
VFNLSADLSQKLILKFIALSLLKNNDNLLVLILLLLKTTALMLAFQQLAVSSTTSTHKDILGPVTTVALSRLTRQRYYVKAVH